MSKYKPEWYEVVWTIGINGKEKSKLFPPDQKHIAESFYEEKVKEIMTIPFSDVRIYLTHTNKLYDILNSKVNRV